MNEPDVSSLLTVDQAIAILDAVHVTPRILRTPLNEASGLRLAGDLAADRDSPPVDRSLMDGFAVRCADVATTPIELPVLATIAAGSTAGPLPARAVMRIMTGAPIPPGADAVIPVEDTVDVGANSVRLLRLTAPGRNIARRGADCSLGQIVLRRGDRIGPAQVAVAASVGAAQVDVFARPITSVLATGAEIVPIDQTPAIHQLRNSNGPMLVSLLTRIGCAVHDHGIVGDDAVKIRGAIESASRDAPFTFISGGMSMGQFDFVPGALRELGFDLRITKLRIKPGKPFVFAAKGDRFIFGLPGNPVSAFVCTLRLAARVLNRAGGGTGEPTWLAGPMAVTLPANGPREFYQPAKVHSDGSIEALHWKGSADIFTLAQASALLIRPENEPEICAGTMVRALEIPQ